MQLVRERAVRRRSVAEHVHRKSSRCLDREGRRAVRDGIDEGALLDFKISERIR